MFSNLEHFTLSTETREHHKLRTALKLPLRDEAYTDSEFKMILARNVVNASRKNYEKAAPTFGKSLVYINFYAEIIDITQLKHFYAFEQSYKFNTFYNVNNFMDKNTYLKLREIILDHYLTMHIIPTTISITDQYINLHCKRMNDKDIANIRTKMNFSNFGFIYKQIPGRKKALIIEDPELSNARIRYNFAISKHRENNSCVVYGIVIDFNEILKLQSFTADSTESLAFVTISACGVISVKEFSKDTNTNQHTITLESVLDLPQSCVLVLQGTKSVSEKIKISSTKEQIIQILEKNCIPHNPKMHRSDLWGLIKKYTLHDNIITDDKFKVHGIEVLYRPLTMPDVPLTPLFDEVIKSVKFKVIGSRKVVQAKDVINKLLAVSEKQTKLFDTTFAEVDSKMYDMDMKMEGLIDHYMYVVKELPRISIDTDDVDYFVTETALTKLSKKILI